jgi:hypothetical protein
MARVLDRMRDTGTTVLATVLVNDVERMVQEKRLASAFVDERMAWER